MSNSALLSWFERESRPDRVDLDRKSCGRGSCRSLNATEPLEFITLLFGNDSLRAGHAEKQARWQDLFAPLIEPRLPDSDRRTLQARAIAATAITCLQAANEEGVRLGGKVDMFDLYDTAVQAIRRPT